MPGGPFDGVLYDDPMPPGSVGYACVVGAPTVGVGFGANAPGSFGIVNGLFFSPGPVSGTCLNTSLGFDPVAGSVG
ncbi:hypothetical protein [Nocardia amamiensis]|uniref:hypothetical protein n=1 Tax=Nocardia amamiensis TaxID=404578 RepID=UPI0009FCFF43|nr:hypothetical protein [Nocardia amamiensis]